MSDRSMERLREGQRIVGASRVIRDGQPVTAEAAKQVIANAAAFIEAAGLSWAKVARAIGCGGSVLSSVVNFKYGGNWQQVILDMDVWLEDELKRQAGPARPAFVRTRVAEEIFAVADAAVVLKTIAVVFGETSSGIGKTMALRAVADEKPGALFVSVETLGATPHGLAKSIGQALRVYLGSTHYSAPMWLKWVKDSLRDTPRLLIVDEIHKLCTGRNDGALHMLRDLYDHTGIPMLWCGTTDLVAYLERRQASAREPLAQIRSRIGLCRDLTDRPKGGGGDGGGGDGGGEPLFTTEEIRRVFAGQKMRLAPDAARYLYDLANLPDGGGLRTCRNLMMMATKINERHGDTLTADMLRGAHQLLIDRNGYSMLRSRLENQKPRPVAKAVPA